MKPYICVNDMCRSVCVCVGVVFCSVWLYMCVWGCVMCACVIKSMCLRVMVSVFDVCGV